MPSVFRAARLSLEKKENDVKDWLPSDFPETAELSWFAEHFAGESFVLTTWPGCSSNDQRLKLFQEKLIHESATYEPWQGMSEEEAIPYKRARQFGEELQLLRSGNEFFNWGGLREKWLCTASGQWHYITPDGRLYRWEGAMNAVAGAVRGVQRSMGTFQLEGQFVTALGEPATERAANPSTMICHCYVHHYFKPSKRAKWSWKNWLKKTDLFGQWTSLTNRDEP